MDKKELKKILDEKGDKKYRFVKWYVDSDRSKESYKKIEKSTQAKLDTAMEWLKEENVQNAIKAYLKSQANIKMLDIYQSMYEKAIAGDVKSAEWVEKFFKSEFFNETDDEIDNYLNGINIPALSGDKNDNK